MSLKCLQCLGQRFVTHPYHWKAMTPATAYFYSTEKSQEFNSKKGFFDAINQKQKLNNTIHKILEKKSIHTTLKVEKKSDPISEGFRTVYQFKYIKYFGLVNRLKIYQTLITALAAVGSSGLYALGMVDSGFVYTATTTGLSGCLCLYSIGYAATNFIGFLYYNEKTDKVRAAYIDKWGRRRDVEMPLNDIMPRSEIGEGFATFFYFPFKRYSTNDTLKLVLRDKSVVYDKNAIGKIFEF